MKVGDPFHLRRIHKGALQAYEVAAGRKEHIPATDQLIGTAGV
jgi:hypothetical protein